MKGRSWLVLIAALGIAMASWIVVREPSPNPGNLSPEQATARRMWSRVNDPSGREHELKALAISLKENPDHAPILVRMAQVSRDLGKKDEALAHLREAVKADPKNREARLELGRALFEAGDIDGAIRETQQLLEIDPSNTDGLYNMGAIYGNLGQDDRAREYWRKAVTTAPDSESGRRAKDALKQIGG